MMLHTSAGKAGSDKQNAWRDLFNVAGLAQHKWLWNVYREKEEIDEPICPDNN